MNYALGFLIVIMIATATYIDKVTYRYRPKKMRLWTVIFIVELVLFNILLFLAYLL